ncbi:hypothetical protein AMTR_s00197p00040170 [Amborella trichopoda]|uniref:Uncharacterized protein n=1 Tax=Amborella trichopoda TaxID=13333 RepID=U5DAM4_AMBTC|nr:hypothetical protein AMTR_s00197p00040170 [Amborella trichopoda]
MEEDDDDFDEGINEDNDGDNRNMQDNWHDPTVVECEVSQGTRTSVMEEEELHLIRAEVERAMHNNYTPRHRCTGCGCCRLII